jgi:hypothetical protein
MYAHFRVELFLAHATCLHTLPQGIKANVSTFEVLDIIIKALLTSFWQSRLQFRQQQSPLVFSSNEYH